MDWLLFVSFGNKALGKNKQGWDLGPCLQLAKNVYFIKRMVILCKI
jgi:hypothetical protein